MCSVVVVMFPLLGVFHRVAQDVGDVLIADAVPNSLPLPAGGDHAGVSQYPQVLGDQRLGQPELFDELSHGVLSDGEQVHDGSTHRIRQRFEEAADRLVLGDLRA